MAEKSGIHVNDVIQDIFGYPASNLKNLKDLNEKIQCVDELSMILKRFKNIFLFKNYFLSLLYFRYVNNSSNIQSTKYSQNCYKSYTATPSSNSTHETKPYLQSYQNQNLPINLHQQETRNIAFKETQTPVISHKNNEKTEQNNHAIDTYLYQNPKSNISFNNSFSQNQKYKNANFSNAVKIHHVESNNESLQQPLISQSKPANYSNTNNYIQNQFYQNHDNSEQNGNKICLKQTFVTNQSQLVKPWFSQWNQEEKKHVKVPQLLHRSETLPNNKTNFDFAQSDLNYNKLQKQQIQNSG